MESFVRIGESSFKNLACPYMGVGWVKNGQNLAYVINEWPLSRSKDLWKILMFDWHSVASIFFDVQLPPLAPNIFSCFSNHPPCSASILKLTSHRAAYCEFPKRMMSVVSRLVYGIGVQPTSSEILEVTNY
jgi:hypothetical protein